MRKTDLIECHECGRSTEFQDSDAWNVTIEQGLIAGFLCPDCQTPEQNAEAEINNATITYVAGTDGRIYGRPKADS